MAAAHNSSSRHVSFITRFSILAEPGTQGWHMTRTITDMEQYRAALFSPARLNAKFQMFEKVTLPSVMAQTSRAFDWHIFTAEALPAPFLARLRTVTAPYAIYITIHTVDGMKSFRSGVNEICEGLKARFGENGFATSRLDDDDGVGPRIVERLSDPKYKPGTVVLFAKLVLQGADLFLNEVLALRLCNLILNLGVDLAFKFQHLQLTGEQLHQL
jgi:hypothetical protein